MFLVNVQCKYYTKIIFKKTRRLGEVTSISPSEKSNIGICIDEAGAVVEMLHVFPSSRTAGIELVDSGERGLGVEAPGSNATHRRRLRSTPGDEGGSRLPKLSRWSLSSRGHSSPLLRSSTAGVSNTHGSVSLPQDDSPAL